MAYYRQTLAECLHDLNTGEVQPYIALGNFLDDFYSSPSDDERQRLLGDEPESAKDEETHRWACFYAALADWFSHKHGFSTPSWVFKDRYRLSEPWFMMSNWRFRAYLLFETPPPFIVRNIFCGDRILMRV